jgi:hypothetical protein
LVLFSRVRKCRQPSEDPPRATLIFDVDLLSVSDGGDDG